jgi:hypothetical protein
LQLRILKLGNMLAGLLLVPRRKHAVARYPASGAAAMVIPSVTRKLGRVTVVAGSSSGIARL